MTQLFEAYQTIGEKKNPEVIEEALPALAMGAAKLAPHIVKGAKAIAPVAKTVAKQIGGAAVAGAAQGAQERAKNFNSLREYPTLFIKCWTTYKLCHLSQYLLHLHP